MTYDHHWWAGAIEFCSLGRFSAAQVDLYARTIAPLGGPCKTQISIWCQAWLNDGKTGPSRKRTKKTYSRVEPVHLEHAINILHDVPTIYQKELCEIIARVYGVHYSSQAMCDALNKAGITRKVSYLLLSPF
jgi:transposase